MPKKSRQQKLKKIYDDVSRAWNAGTAWNTHEAANHGKIEFINLGFTIGIYS
jgi:hypothetical protein